MKIVAIIGSKRQGNTYAMVSTAAQTLSEENEVDILALGEMTYSFCDGCLQCDLTGTCHFADDMSAAIERIKSADGLIIGSPARWGLLSGELKTFFDRLNPMACNDLLSGKKAIVFAVGQSSKTSEDAESIKLACSSIETFCENADIEVIDRVYAFDCLEKDAIRDKSIIQNRCVKAAKKLAGALASHE